MSTFRERKAYTLSLWFNIVAFVLLGFSVLTTQLAFLTTQLAFARFSPLTYLGFSYMGDDVIFYPVFFSLLERFNLPLVILLMVLSILLRVYSNYEAKKWSDLLFLILFCVVLFRWDFFHTFVTIFVNMLPLYVVEMFTTPPSLLIGKIPYFSSSLSDWLYEQLVNKIVFGIMVLFAFLSPLLSLLFLIKKNRESSQVSLV